MAAHWFHALRWSRVPHPGYVAMRPHGFQEARKLPLLEFLCWYYAEYEREIAEALEWIPADRAFDCRYEDLVGAYRETMAGLLEFIGVEPEPAFMEETARTVRESSIGKHRATLTPSEIEEAREYLARHGVEAGPSMDGEEAKR